RRKAVGLSAWYSGHLVLGAVMLAAFWVHSGGSLGGPVTAALAVATLGSFVLGSWGALLYRVIPRRLARVVGAPHLPEDEDRERQRIESELRDVLSGRDEAKGRAGRGLSRRWTSRIAPWQLLLSGASRHDLRARLERQVALDDD